MIQAVNVIIFNEQSQVLGVSRKFDHNDFGTPGGKLEDYDEDLIAAIKRETLEETGVEIYDVEPLFDCELDGTHEHTYIAKYRGEINYDKEKEPALVAWVEPEVIMNGSFGKYNEQCLGMLGIERKLV